jgi:hypothetical protein
LALLKSEGWAVGKVEQTIPKTFIKRDLFGFLDLIAIKPGEPVLGVQVTSGSNVSARVQKINELEASAIWREVARLEVHGWRKVVARGQRKTWECRRVRL